MTRKQRLTDAQADWLIARTRQRLQLGEELLKRYGATQEELNAGRENDDPIPMDIGTTIDLYGDGATWTVTSVADDRRRCTLAQIANTARR